MQPPQPPGRAVVLIPVKAFHLAKSRLSPELSPAERAQLAQAMAEAVLRAASPLPVAVVCDDPAVAAWATEHRALVLRCPGRGLDQAVADGVDALVTEGFHRIVVAHADLPLARSLSWVAEFEGVTLVPDRRDDGTNVICIPADSGFVFAYGPGSFHRHAAEARRLGRGLRVMRDPALGWDVDVPSDLVLPADPRQPCAMSPYNP